MLLWNGQTKLSRAFKELFAPKTDTETEDTDLANSKLFPIMPTQRICSIGIMI